VAAEHSVSSRLPDDGAEQRLVTAQELYEDLQTYMAAGFTRKEAMRWLCRTVVNITPAQYPPEMFEFWERQNALAITLNDELKPDD
jgi:hypothetical protein